MHRRRLLERELCKTSLGLLIHAEEWDIKADFRCCKTESRTMSLKKQCNEHSQLQLYSIVPRALVAHLSSFRYLESFSSALFFLLFFASADGTNNKQIFPFLFWSEHDATQLRSRLFLLLSLEWPTLNRIIPMGTSDFFTKLLKQKKSNSDHSPLLHCLRCSPSPLTEIRDAIASDFDQFVRQLDPYCCYLVSSYGDSWKLESQRLLLGQ